MNSIAQCGDHLRLSADGTHLCTDCPDTGQPNEICCLSSELIATTLGQPRNDCGLIRRDTIPPIFGFRRYCLVACESVGVLNQDFPGLPGTPFNYTASCRLTQPVTFEGTDCIQQRSALFDWAWTENDQGRESSRDVQLCLSVLMGCPPIGSSSTPNFVDPLCLNIPTVGFVAAFSGTRWRLLNLPSGGINPSLVDTTASWSCPNPGTEFTYTATTRLYNPGPSGRVQVGTITTNARFRVSHDEKCDGSPSPHEGACTATSGPCQPGPESYRIATPCNPASRNPAVLFRAENVLACGVVPGPFGECVKISPTSAATTDPESIDGVIVDLVVRAGVYPASCCECEPACPSDPIVPSPCWAGGVRNGLTGAWVPNTPFVTQGACCCNPDDLITISEMDSLWESQPFTFHRRLARPITIRRGDLWKMDTIETITITDTGEFYQQNEITFGRDDAKIAAFECSGGPWGGGVSADGFGPAQLQIPQEFVGLHTSRDGGVRDMPCPIDSNGEGNGTRVLSKNVSVTCTTFFYDGEWEWNNGINVNRITHRLRLSITPAPNSQRPECSGGCGQTGGGGVPLPPGGPGELTPSPGGPGNAGLMGGCGGCGRQGEL